MTNLSKFGEYQTDIPNKEKRYCYKCGEKLEENNDDDLCSYCSAEEWEEEYDDSNN